MSPGQAIWKRLSSSTSITIKQIPSKAHHHIPLPDSSFPKGYLLTGIHCGVKKDPQARDLALILSTSLKPTSAAACFTRNVFKAAPVLVSQEVLQKSAGRARAIVVNSGCANAVTGKQGLEDAWAMVSETDVLLQSDSQAQGQNQTLVMSTGVIGQKLPISKIISGIRSQKTTSATSTLGSGFEAWESAAKAFMTTDTFPKLRSRNFTIKGRENRMAGMDNSTRRCWAASDRCDCFPPVCIESQIRSSNSSPFIRVRRNSVFELFCGFGDALAACTSSVYFDSSARDSEGELDSINESTH